MPSRPDYVIVGGGHNSLVCAAYLAKAGRQVMVLEQRSQLGGLASAEQVFGGYSFPVAFVHTGNFPSKIIDDLHLSRHGLEILPSHAAATSLLPDGGLLTLWNDIERSIQEIERFSPEDASSFAGFLQGTRRNGRMLSHLAWVQPPDLSKLDLRTAVPWLAAAFRLRRMGARGMMQFLRTLPRSSHDLLNESFMDDALKGLLAFSSIAGTFLGPQEVGTAFQFYYQHLGDEVFAYKAGRFVRGGMAAFTKSLQEAASSFGVEIKLNAAVVRIIMSDGQAAGVELASGEQIFAGAVISGADPRRTLFGLLPAPALEPQHVRRLRNIKFRGSTTKINLALSRLPERIASHAEPERFDGFIVVSPSLEYLQRAYDHAKYRRLPEELAMEMVIPTLIDPALAPNGHHILSIDVRYTPYQLAGAAWPQQNQDLLDIALSQLARHFSDIREITLHSQIISPVDYETEFGLTEGSLYHGQMGLDQLLFMRPFPGFSGYQSPIPNLYLCGAGTHPGGGISGIPGYNAARYILERQ